MSLENVLEKGEVEATKEGKEKSESSDCNQIESVSKSKSAMDKNKDDVDKDDDKDASADQEVVFIQDMGFTVKIVSPGAEPFDIQVSSMELVQVIMRTAGMILLSPECYFQFYEDNRAFGTCKIKRQCYVDCNN